MDARNGRLALAVFFALSGCLPAENKMGATPQPAVIAPKAYSELVEAYADDGCLVRGDALAMAYAAAAKIPTPIPVACGHLGPLGSLVAGCETGDPLAITLQPLTCAALKLSAMQYYPPCVAVGLAIAKGAPEREKPQCSPKPPPPEKPIEIGSLSGPVYIYKSKDRTLIRTVLDNGQSQIETITNPDGSRSVDTDGFTANYDRDGKLSNVTWK